MKRKSYGILLLLIIMGLAVTAFAAGTMADSFITVFEFENTYWPPIRKSIQQALTKSTNTYLTEGKAAMTAAVNQRIDNEIAEILAQKVKDRIIGRVVEKSRSMTVWNTTPVTVKEGDIITGSVGAGILLKSGSAKVWGNGGIDLINTAAGTGEFPGTAVTANVYYMIPEDRAVGIVITSAKAEILMQDGAVLTHAYQPQYTDIADSLADMGLFRGTNEGYELDRAPTRQEALIMLIRLLGEEPAALTFEGETTFTDLTGWMEGRRYIAYGHHMGYTNGESATTFAQYKTAGLEMYLTFVLRALGYNDAAGDFIWNTTSRTLAVELGLLGQQDLEHINQYGFLRDHVVKISYNALDIKLKGQNSTLRQKPAWSLAGGE